VDDSRDAALSEAGHVRARALATVLGDAGITHVLVTQYQRTRQTAQPTLDALTLVAIAVPSDPHDETLRRLGALKPTDRVLLVAHSDTIPALLKRLAPGTNVTLGRNDYDSLFVVAPGGTGATVTRLHVGPPPPR
jgi:broad specificity phosphatase PhoE